MSNDTFFQIKQVHTGDFDYANPLFDTLLFGAFVVPSEQIFGVADQGVFLYGLFQALCTATAFGASCCYMERLSVPNGFRLASLVFFAMFPAFAIYSVTMVKDTVFSWVYVLYFIAIIELIHTQGKALSSKRFLIFLVLTSVFVALTKRTGIHLVIVVGVVLLIVFRKEWKRFLPALLVPILIMYALLPLIVYPLLQGSTSKTQDAYGSLLQQTARYVVLHEDEVTPEERSVIDKALHYDTLATRYDWYGTDGVKDEYSQDLSSSEFIEYLQVWAKQGLRHPWTYVEATIGTAYGYFAPVASIQTYVSYIHSYDDGSLVNTPDALVSIRIHLKDFISSFNEAPLSKILTSMAFYTWWIPLFSFWLVFRNDKRLAWTFLPVLASILILVISPGSLGADRYALPLIYTAPLILSLIFVAIKGRLERSEGEIVEKAAVNERNLD